ncbi:EAL domain-containing protein [Paraburkholderia lycopersici]|uniref:cyclic-guanylate-specific phosphodiesterase n=1 Tax=Paraburkholderia lycopersici TaxID=416944 RepID=A0A1G6M9G0_9BURK|nr:EAL domain-containing protein [Paraburkholderia lycopersici]SDC52232.1 sensor c-di-GMP phosphodiesterase, contains CSS-motif sensor and EAL domain [Paraburkholderia lycopersici]
MSPRLTALTTFCAVAFAVLATLAVAMYASDAVTERQQRQQIDVFSRRALLRAELVTAEAEAALRQLAPYGGTPCTNDHLQRLRQAEEQFRYIREAGWTDGVRLRCTSLQGPIDVALPPPTWTFGDGFTAWHTETGGPGNERSMLNVRFGNHVVVIDSRFYLDIVPLDDTIELAMLETQDAAVISRWAHAGHDLVRAALRRESASEYFQGRYYVVERSRRYPIAVVAYEPEDRLRANLLGQIRNVLPPAFVVSAFGTWLVMRWRRKLRTPRNALLEGIRRHQFVAWMQPLVSLETGRCVGAEALVRWKLEDGTMVAPDTFIPMAESLGLIEPITDQVVRSVFEGVGTALANRRDLHVSINLAGGDLACTRVLDTLKTCLAKYAVRPEQIWFEVIERTLVDTATSAPVLETYRAAGHRVFIDDFGTGYSSLSYLQALPVDGIKLDRSFLRSFLRSFATGEETNKIVPHIIEMAHSLGLMMVAEGVETQAQARYLRAHGVQYAQGWLYAKAMPADEFLRYLQHEAAATGNA